MTKSVHEMGLVVSFVPCKHRFIIIIQFPFWVMVEVWKSIVLYSGIYLQCLNLVKKHEIKFVIFVCVCVHACVRVCVRVCVFSACVCACARMHKYGPSMYAVLTVVSSFLSPCYASV